MAVCDLPGGRLLQSLIFVCCVFCMVTMPEVRCEEQKLLSPRQLNDFDERKLDRSFAEGIEFLVSSQRKDGGGGGPQWTGGVDSDPIPGSFRSFEIAVTAMCLEALLSDDSNSTSLHRSKSRALRFMLERTGKIKRAGPADLPNVWAHCYCIQTFVRMHQTSTSEKQKNELANAIEQHMEGLKRWQSIHGGWFYYGSGMSQPINPSCSFVNAAVLVALARARQIGLHAEERKSTRLNSSH